MPRGMYCTRRSEQAAATRCQVVASRHQQLAEKRPITHTIPVSTRAMGLPCISESYAEVEARLHAVHEIIRTHEHCRRFPRSPHLYSPVLFNHSHCEVSLASALNIQLPTWDAARDADYHARSTIQNAGQYTRRYASLQIGSHLGGPYLSSLGQQASDLLLYAVFFNKWPLSMQSSLRFIESGTRQGYSESNTFMLEKYLGWGGWLVEPTVDAICTVPYNRPRGTAVHAAFCAPPETLGAGATQKGVSGDGRTFQLSRKWLRDNAKNTRDCNLTTSMLSAPCMNFPTFASMHLGGRAVDYFSLDIDNEDAQLAILKDLQLMDMPLRPAVITVECETDKCVGLLRAVGYDTIKMPGCSKSFRCKPSYWSDVLAWRNTCVDGVSRSSLDAAIRDSVAQVATKATKSRPNGKDHEGKPRRKEILR